MKVRRTIVFWETQAETLNTRKTKYVLFTKDSRELDASVQTLYINNDAIERVQTSKFLGMTIDKHLDWSSHIHICKNKIASGIYVLNSMKYTLPTS
jgi:hypothetical protein